MAIENSWKENRVEYNRILMAAHIISGDSAGSCFSAGIISDQAAARRLDGQSGQCVLLIWLSELVTWRLRDACVTLIRQWKVLPVVTLHPRGG